MELVCIEKLGSEEEYEGFPSYDFNIYFFIDSKREEEIMRNFLLGMKKRFKFLRNGNRTELCVFLSDSTKTKALEFSNKLKRKLKESIKIETPPEDVKEVKVPDSDPNHVISFRIRNGVEELAVYEVDKQSQIHYLNSIFSANDDIKSEIKRLIKGVG